MLAQLIISVQIVLIDIVMAADNAIIIGLIAANFAPDNRKKIIAWGVGAAFLFRIIFVVFSNIFLRSIKFKKSILNTLYHLIFILKIKI